MTQTIERSASESLPSASAAQVERRDGDAVALVDLLAAEEPDALDLVESAERARLLRDALRRLPDRERLVVEARFGIGREEETLAAIGARLGISRERVRQIQCEALRRLKCELTVSLRVEEAVAGAMVGVRRCIACHEWRPLRDYPGRRARRCTACSLRLQREAAVRQRELRAVRRREIRRGVDRCPVCKAVRPLDQIVYRAARRVPEPRSCLACRRAGLVPARDRRERG